MQFHLSYSAKTYSILFRVILVIFTAFYFLPTGINFHKFRIFHLPCDYLGHAFFCFILFFFYINSLNLKKGAGSLFFKLTLLLIIVNSFEFIQLLLPRRSFDLIDIFSNLSGILIGAVLAFLNKFLRLKM